MSPLVFRATALLFIYLFAHRSRFPHSHLPPVSPNDSSASSSLGANMTVHLHEGQHVVSPSSEVRSLCNQSINPALWLYLNVFWYTDGQNGSSLIAPSSVLAPLAARASSLTPDEPF